MERSAEPPEAPGKPRTRAMTLDDLEQVVRLERICFPDPWSEYSFRHELTDAGDAGFPRVIELDGRVVGYLIGWYILDEAHLANLALDPEVRGMGLGAFLLEEFLREGASRGCTLALLEVRVTNHPAIRLYERFGFRGVSVRKNYYAALREDALVMMRPLASETEETDGFGL